MRFCWILKVQARQSIVLYQRAKGVGAEYGVLHPIRRFEQVNALQFVGVERIAENLMAFLLASAIQITLLKLSFV